MCFAAHMPSGSSPHFVCHIRHEISHLFEAKSANASHAMRIFQFQFVNQHPFAYEIRLCVSFNVIYVLYAILLWAMVSTNLHRINLSMCGRRGLGFRDRWIPHDTCSKANLYIPAECDGCETIPRGAEKSDGKRDSEAIWVGGKCGFI